jgi:hypothetical protein
MTRTQGPWKVIGKNDTQVCSSAIQGASGYVVARTYHSPSAKIPYKDLWAECEANAAFIVRTVNAHDELVSALEQAKNIFDNILTDAQLDRRMECGIIVRDFYRTVESALAKAEGRT